MLAITITEPGGPDVLELIEVSDPEARAGEVLVDVTATAINRADLLQRQGNYPVPPGASEILGMECSGVISAIGAGVEGWQVGDRVCALLAGGGYAEKVAVPATQLLPVPTNVSLLNAAALPEAVCTVWSNLVMVARLTAGETVLIHGGASGIGTMAIQVAVALGARVAVTASRDAALQACQELGADITINYRDSDFVEVMSEAGGADVILDVVGAKYLQRNIAVLRDGGRLVTIGMMGGTKAELDLSALMAKRASITSTALRSRRVVGKGSKAEVVAAVREQLWPWVAEGKVRPVVEAVLPLRDAGDAHARLERGGHLGKIVLQVRE